ncbi:hypothetical protein K1F50_14770 [Muricauda oceani]|uniref:DUF4340 domain-containing protein n=1 Tax=Flagellimonas oceani TaxID=2698672 RepID=A0A6G7J3J8_9FLAO|nr:hypothetical protein [Allomuricauda oceani]MBW8244069.1 hypothetical protein [Allomuricauda oceani]QII45042.1 hypothetical protein GVT53_10235 [Allomuricauda oceani]
MLIRNTYTKLIGTIILCIGMVVILFLSSERQIHRNNAFTRRFPPHPVTKEFDLDIGYNSYYIAGFDKNYLYLGNQTAPWHMLQVNLGTKDTVHIRLEPRDRKIQYRSLRTSVLPPYFFVMDGTMPFILRGKINEWKADPWMERTAYFNRAIPIDSNRVFIRTINANNQKTTLGIIKKTDSFQVHLDTSLLESQLDGVFDVDGMLVNSENNQTLGYVYYYRNQFITFDSELTGQKKQRTIDTVQYAQLQVALANKKGQIQMKAPPLTINTSAVLSKELMLIQSDRLGRNESREMLDQAIIIDAYNYQKKTYEFSFYLYHIQKHKVREFTLHGNLVIALIDNKVSVYRTLEPYFTNYIPDKAQKITTGR